MASNEITELLRAWSEGDSEARETVWPRLYEELKIVARSVLRRRHQGKGPSTTSLVHDAALRLLNVDIDWNDRHHFYAASARAMRFIVVDETRRRLADKRGGDPPAAPLDDAIADPNAKKMEEVMAVHQALKRLSRVNQRQEKLVELRYFAGLSVDETAEILGVSVPTVVRDWRAVRTWLQAELQPAP